MGTPLLVSLALSTLSGAAFARHITNKDDVRADLESNGWTVAYGSELDQGQEGECVVEIAAAALVSGGTAAVLAAAGCLREAAVASVEALPADLVRQALGNLGQVLSSGGLEVQANIAAYNHEECADFWPYTCVPTPNTFQPYIRFRGHAPGRAAPAGKFEIDTRSRNSSLARVDEGAWATRTTGSARR